MPHLPPPSTLPPGSIVDAYVRDSGGPRQDASTDQQIAEIEKYCQTYGLTLRHKFADVAKSGGSTSTRDEFNNLIDSTRRVEDRPAGVLLWNYARFARDLDDAIYYKALLRNRSIIVHSLTDPIPEGQYGRIIEFFIDISNEEKRRQTSTDAKRGLRDLVLKHGCIPGTPPRGFKREPVEIGLRRDGSPHIAHRWVPDPDVVPRIQRAFTMRASGSTLAQVHAETKIFTSLNSYKTFFANRIFIGILEFGDLVIENYCEPLVDMQTWNTVQKIIRDYAQARTSERHPRRVDSAYLLSGLVFCDCCGSPMFGNTATRHHITGRDEAYRCSAARRKRECAASRIPRRKLEDAVFATLHDHILLPDSLSAMLEVERHATDHRETKRTERLAILNVEKKKLSTQIVNITRAIAERGHSSTLLDKLTELEAQRAMVLTEFTELNNLRFVASPPLTEEEIIIVSNMLSDILHEAPAEQVKQILQSFIHKILAKKTNGQITGSITYFTPPLADLLRSSPPDSPPFESPPTGNTMLPISSRSVGAHLYRQIFSHPIISPKKAAQKSGFFDPYSRS
jgi:DNA invertase Pin-like site-specific DNA recombinase